MILDLYLKSDIFYNWIIGGIMEEPQRFEDNTLNNNIAKELIWRRNSPYFYQTLYTQ